MKRIIILYCLCCLTSLGFAQKMSLGYIFPAGGVQGDSVDILVAGLNLNQSEHVLISGVGVKGRVLGPYHETIGNKKKRKSKLTDQSSPQLADRVQVRLFIESNAPLGTREFKLQSDKGISNKLFFEVSAYPNHTIPFEQAVKQDTLALPKLPLVLCGQVPPGGINRYRFTAEAGKEYVVDVKARRLLPYIADAVPGWFQAVVKIENMKGEEIAYGDDYQNSPDPFVTFCPKETGDYVLSIHDAIYRGREDFGYRITLGEIPWITHAYPPLIQEGKKTKLSLKGINLPTKSITVKKPKITEPLAFVLRHEGENIPVLIPAQVMAKGEHLVNLPKSKRIENIPGNHYLNILEQAYCPQEYKVFLEDGEVLATEIKANRLGSHIDLILEVINEQGEVITRVDDFEDPLEGMITHHADPQVVFTAPRQGDYTLRVSELTGKFGASTTYALAIGKDKGSFQTFVSPSSLSIPQGGTAVIRFDMVNSKKLNPKGTFAFKGLPSSFKLSNHQIPQWGNMAEVSITATQDAEIGKLQVTPVIQLENGEEREILSSDQMMQAFYYTHRLVSNEFDVNITPKSPFSIRITGGNYDQITAISKDIKVEYELTCDSGFDSPIKVMLNRKLKFIIAEEYMIDPKVKKGTLTLRINAEALIKQKYLNMPIHLVATVGGEVQKQGQRSFENAQYREVSPIVYFKKVDKTPTPARKKEKNTTQRKRKEKQ